MRFSELQKSSENLIYWTRRETLTVSLHRTLPSEIVGWSGFDGLKMPYSIRNKGILSYNNSNVKQI